MLTPELVVQGTLTEKERSVVLQCCEEDKCFIQEGPLAGFIDYEAGFFQRYIISAPQGHHTPAPQGLIH